MSERPNTNPAGDIPLLPPIQTSSSSRTASNPESEPDQTDPDPQQPSQLPQPHKHDSDQIPRHRFLSPKEWGIMAHAIGGLRDREKMTPAHPTSWWWPPKGMPHGLYRDAVTKRVKSYYLYHISSSVRWILMLAQLLIGASLTALGSMSLSDGVPITVLGATNTVIAGILAFLQNSGLPDRYRYDMAEFEAVEDHVKELLDSGIALTSQATDQIIAECFDLYRDAKMTIAANMPANYNSRLARTTGRKAATAMPPAAASKASRATMGGGNGSRGE